MPKYSKILSLDLSSPVPLKTISAFGGTPATPIELPPDFIALTTLNEQRGKIQTLTIGTAGNNFNIISNDNNHQFNIPDAGLDSRGFVNTEAQTFSGAKTFTDNLSVLKTISSISFISPNIATIFRIRTEMLNSNAGIYIGTTTKDAFKINIDGELNFVENVSASKNLNLLAGHLQFGAASEPAWDSSTRLWMQSGFGLRLDAFQFGLDVGVSRTRAITIHSNIRTEFHGLTDFLQNQKIKKNSPQISFASPSEAVNYNVFADITNSTDGGLRISKTGPGLIARFGPDIIDFKTDMFTYGTSPQATEGFQLFPNGVFYHRRASNAAASMTLFLNGNTVVGEIRTSTTATSYLTTSDRRLKVDFGTTHSVLDKILRVPVHLAKFKSDESENLQYMYMADEIQIEFPEYVTGKKDGIKINGDGESVPEYQMVNHSGMVPALHRAIQEIYTEFNNRISELESEVEYLNYLLKNKE